MPDHRILSDAQTKAVRERKKVGMTFGLVEANDKETSWFEYCGHRVLCISDLAKEVHMRLMVCAHVKQAGHRGVNTTL